MSDHDWRLVPASDLDVHSWSFGSVKDVPSLYDPRTFGPKQNFRCDCGKYAGEAYENIICDRCWVKIVADAAAVRKERLGHLRLACSCEHPVTGSSLEDFPIAPIGFRINADGSPNALGRKYEHLVTINGAATEALPSREDAHAYYPAARDFDTTDLSAAMSDIVGGGAGGSRGDTLLGLITAAIASADPHMTPLIRAFGYALSVEVTM